MDPEKRRHVALLLTIVFVVALTMLLAWGVIHKINKKLIEPNIIVTMQAVPTTQPK